MIDWTHLATWAFGSLLLLVQLWLRATSKAEHLETRAFILQSIKGEYVSINDLHNLKERLDDLCDRLEKIELQPNRRRQT